MANERRSERRASFSEDDGVICVLIKAQASGVTLILPTLDISKNGFKFLSEADAKRHFPVGEKLLLKEIIGTRNVKLTVPIGLVVRWHKADGEKVIFGCEISFAASESRKQYTRFVESELAFGGAAIPARQRDTSENTGPPGGAEPMGASENTEKPAPSAAQARKGALILAALAAVSVVLLGSILYTRHIQRTLADRMTRLEESTSRAPELIRAIGQVKTDMASIEAELSKLSESVRRGQNADKLLNDRVGDLERSLLKAKAPVPDGASPPRAETAKPTAPVESAASAPAAEKVAQNPPAEAAGGPNPPQSPEAGRQIEGAYHRVQEGENLFRISVKYNVMLNKLAEINGMNVDDPIYAGQRIKLP